MCVHGHKHTCMCMRIFKVALTRASVQNMCLCLHTWARTPTFILLPSPCSKLHFRGRHAHLVTFQASAVARFMRGSPLRRLRAYGLVIVCKHMVSWSACVCVCMCACFWRLRCVVVHDRAHPRRCTRPCSSAAWRGNGVAYDMSGGPAHEKDWWDMAWPVLSTAHDLDHPAWCCRGTAWCCLGIAACFAI